MLPVSIQTFMLALVSACDALMLGFFSQEAMAAVSLAGQVQFVINIFVSAISVGVGIMMAQYWGKKDIVTIEKIIPIGLRFNLIVGILFMLAAFLMPGLLMGYFTDDPTLWQYGKEYLIYVAPSYFFCALSQIYLTVLKNSECSHISSRISSLAVILNIIINYLLIFGIGPFPQLGIKGAAIATVIARFVELILAIQQSHQKDRVRVNWLGMKDISKELKQDFNRYTLPVLVAGLVWALAYTSYSAIMGHMGSAAVSANSIVTIVRSLTSCFIRGVATGAAIIVGNELGANELERAKQDSKIILLIAFIVGILTCIVMIILAFILSRYLGVDSLTAHYLKYMMIFSGINLIFQSCMTTTLDGFICAGGDAKFDMNTNIVTMWCFTLPLGLLAAFVFKWPAIVVFCIVNLDEIIKTPYVLYYYFKYKWVRNITREY